MKVRTYYWHDRVTSPLGLRLRRALGLNGQRYFLVGNAGDIFARELFRWHYDRQCVNSNRGGRRLLLVGSIAHRVQNGDIVCGIGVKSAEIPHARTTRIRIVGVRGPRSLEAFRQAGHDVSGVRFLLDPGLMIRFMVERLTTIQDRGPSGAIFIPHYGERDRHRHGLPKGIRFVDIDASPLDVAREIIASELVYASSLHGIIFAHALKRPAVLVAPQTKEPFLKYEDYFLSIGQGVSRPLEDIGKVDFRTAPNSPLELSYKREDFAFPELEFLSSAGVMQ